MDFMEELEAELNAIAAGAPAPIANWRTTPIKGWEHGFAGEAQAIRQKEWWNKPREEAGRSLNDILKRAGLGRLQDTDERENEGHEKGTGTTAKEIAERQREKEKNLSSSASKNRVAHADDERAPWQKYLGEPRADARTWLKDFSARVDTNSQDNKAWWGTLRDHVASKPQNARVEDLNPQLVELCVRNLCTE
jgi:hypothetical protein